MQSNKEKVNIKLCFVTALLSAIIVVVLFYVLGMTPFGNRSMAGGDIDVSQLDLYSYLKNCLLGKDTFGYSFSMGLGGDTANVFAYGMSSPFNYLIIFFDQANFHSYFDVMVILKIATIGFTSSYYFQRRFDGDLKSIFVIILALCFAFSQYCIAQIVNIFWLDGVAMLPLILLGVYEIITEEKPFTLIFSVFFSILFGWYIGVTDCLFSIFWFIFEYFYILLEKQHTFRIKEFAGKLLNFAFAGITGALLSCFFFLPVLASIRAGNRGSLNWNSLSLKLTGNPLTAISNDIIGGISDPSKVALFAGSVAIIGCVAFFVSTYFDRNRKIITGIFLFFVVMTFYWSPLFLLFSMMKNATSFWFRYSYIGTFTIVFIAGLFFCGWDKEKNKNKKRTLIVATGLWMALFLIVNVKIPSDNCQKLAITIFTLIIIGSIIVLMSDESCRLNRRREQLFSGLLIISCVLELGYNAKILMNYYGFNNIQIYQEYVHDENSLINQIKEADSGLYRISKSFTRKQELGGHLTANYNEPLGYNYKGISTYTNSPDDRQRTMLEHLGYRTNGENMYIVNTSILPADSLLGVKYFLSEYAINGYKPVDGMQSFNNKMVYENPFVLPWAFTYNTTAYVANSAESSNSFLELNRIYSELYGQKIDLFVPLNYNFESVDDEMHVHVSIQVPSGNYALYGNLPWQYEYDGAILSGDTQITEYSKWTSPSVFYIPSDAGENEVELDVISNSGQPVSIMNPQFYALDLDMMKQVSERLQQKAVSSLVIKGKNIQMDAVLKKGQAIFTAFAYDKGWIITDNGQEVEPQLYDKCLMVLKLGAGEHHIEMKYRQPGEMAGIGCTLIGCLLLLVWSYRFMHKNIKAA